MLFCETVLKKQNLIKGKITIIERMIVILILKLKKYILSIDKMPFMVVITISPKKIRFHFLRNYKYIDNHFRNFTIS